MSCEELKPESFAIRAIENVVLAAYELAKFFKTLPIIPRIELIGMTPYIEKRGLFGIHFQEFVSKREHFFFIKVEYRWHEGDEVVLERKACVCFNTACVFYTRVFSNELFHAGIVVSFGASAGVSHTDYVISAECGEVFSVLLNLTDNFFVGRAGEKRMCERVCGYLVTAINFRYLFGSYLVVANFYTVADESAGLAEKLGIKVESTFKTVFV